LQTSNFSQNGRNPKAVAISQGVPPFYQGARYEPLAPPWWLISIKDPVEYRQKYEEAVLAKLDPAKVFKDLGEGSILLCWEKEPDGCHRRIVAEWLENALGVDIPELMPEPSPQMNLFERT